MSKQSISTGTFGVAKWVVSPDPTQGTHTTITAAMAAASSGDTIWIREGTYTEDFTQTPGVDITGAPNASGDPNVLIIGTLTMSGSGSSTVSNVGFQTNGNPCFVISGTGACELNITNVEIDCTNATGISFTNSNSDSSIYLSQLVANIGATGITLFDSTSPGFMAFYGGTFTNSGSSDSPCTVSGAGSFFYAYNCNFNIPFSFSSSSTNTFFFCSIFNPSVTALSCSEPSVTYLNNCYIESDAAVAIFIDSGSTVSAYTSTINSSSSDVITGGGTLNYGGLIFTSSSGLNVTTQNSVALTVPQGGTGLTAPNAYELIAGGITSKDVFQQIDPATSGYVLTSNGSGALPTFQASGGGGSVTLTGDSGSMSGSSLTLYANLASVACGSTILFTNSGTTSQLNVSDGNNNTMFGNLCGNNSSSGNSNCAYGKNAMTSTVGSSGNNAFGLGALQSVQNSDNNVAMGQGALQNLTGGSGSNTCMGTSSGGGLVTGTNNTMFGFQSGVFNSGTDSNNIYFNHQGVSGDNNVLRLGQGTGGSTFNLAQAFIAGINGNTVSNTAYVTIDTSTDQLGTTSTSPTAPALNVQVFTTSGTYTPTSGMAYCTIECVGGGAGGGGAASTSTTQAAAGSGGGGGGYARLTASSGTIGASQTVTIGTAGSAGVGGGASPGNGGTTSVGSICVAGGGNAGTNGTAASSSLIEGGDGGIGTTGDFFTTGSDGQGSFGLGTLGVGFSGGGGGTYFGGSQSGNGGPNTPGTAGYIYGGGGNGAINIGIQTAINGGAGSAGLVVITEYI